MSDIHRRDTGSAELDRILAERDRIHGKMYRRAGRPSVAEEARIEPEVAVPEDVDALPKFPFLPRLGEPPFSDWSGPAKIRHIQRVVAIRYNVTAIDMVSVRRTQTVIRPRMIAMYFSRILTTRSLTDIGNRFGARDHTTVLYTVRKIEKMMADNAAFAEEIETLKGML